MRLVLFGTAILCAACTQPSTAGAPPVSSSAAPPKAAAPAESDEEATTSWITAVRYERWPLAERLVDALPEATRNSPKMRFLRARIYRENGKQKAALELLATLDKALPSLAKEIRNERARCRLVCGPYEEAAAHFAESSNAQPLTWAAEAYERAGNLSSALLTSDKAVHAASRSKSRDEQAVEPVARAIRARLLEKLGKKSRAARDWHWLATKAPTHPHAAGADEKLTSFAPNKRLTAAERRERALEFGRAGDIEAALRELDYVANAPGPALPKAELIHAKGFAYYFSRQDYLKASELLDEASKLSQSLRVRDAFYSARALSRAQKDDRAVEKYAALAKAYPGTPYAEEARYLVARLTFLLGDTEKAALEYDRYLDRHGKRGRFVESARYERALTWLGGDRAAQAAETFEKLAERERSDRAVALLMDLQAVALALAGQRERAAELHRQVIDTYPLTFAALSSHARLVALGEIPPPPVPGASGESNPTDPLDVELPPAVALLHEIGLDHDAERLLSEAEPEITSRYAPRGYEALCAAYSRLAPAEQRYRASQSAIRAGVLSSAPTDATRWAWECLYPRAYDGAVRAAARRNGIASDLIVAVMRQESAFRARAVSSANAVGLMQLIPPTARRVAAELGEDYDGENLLRPEASIRYGSFYLAKLLGRFGGSVALATAAYNAGPKTVSRWLEANEKLPLDVWVASIPYRETREYVQRVIENQARYGYLRDGVSGVPVLDLDLPQGKRALPDDY